jgi:hypothetical protein
MIRRSAWICVGIFALLTVGARPALAGPPLLCHPFDIAGARSLPWDGTASWFDGADGYDISRVVEDTTSLLTPDTPVIVRMETLRRASIYASADRKVASRLLATLTGRARKPDADALAYLDAAYVTEALRQIGRLKPMGEFRDRVDGVLALVADADGYALIKKSVALRPDDPALAFAAALIAAERNRDAYQSHARAARAGVERDVLLARNIKQVSY